MDAEVRLIMSAVDKASGTIQKTRSSVGGLQSAVSSTVMSYVGWGAAIAGVQKIIGGSLTGLVKYADDVRAIALASGTSATETSRFIQVLDDFGITAQEALTATRKLTSEGYAPNIDSLAQLAVRYQALETPQQRNALLIKTLGRAGLEWAKVLSLDVVELRNLGKAVEQNLLLNEEGVKSATDFKLAQDALQDSVRGLGHVFALELSPTLTDAMDLLTGFLQIVTGQAESWNLGDVVQGIKDQRDALLDLTQVQEEVAEGAEEISVAQDAVNTRYQTMFDLIPKLADASAEATAKIKLDLLEQQLAIDGLSAAEMDFLVETGVAWGIYTQEQAKAAISTFNDVSSMVRQFDRAREAGTAAMRNIPEGQPLMESALKDVTTVAAGFTDEMKRASAQSADLRNKVRALDGMEAWIDIFIQTHGSIPTFTNQGPIKGSDPSRPAGSSGGFQRRFGGPVRGARLGALVENAPTIYSVGEFDQPEVFRRTDDKTYLIPGDKGGEVVPLKEVQDKAEPQRAVTASATSAADIMASSIIQSSQATTAAFKESQRQLREMMVELVDRIPTARDIAKAVGAELAVVVRK